MELERHESMDAATRQEPAGEDGAIEPAELGVAARATLPTPGADERYSVRGLTALWSYELTRRSKHTHRSYTYAVTEWLDYCLRSRIDPLRARRADVDDWVAQLGNPGRSTVNARLAGVRSWYRYLISNDIDTTDPVAHVARDSRRDESRTPYLDEDGLNRLLNAATQRAERAAGTTAEIATRDAAILRVLATTAVRSGAVRNADLTDLTEQAGHRILRYRAKGGHESFKPLVPYATAMLDRYLNLRAIRRRTTVAELTGPAFATVPYHGRPGDGPLPEGALQKMLRGIARAAGLGVADNLVPHSIRHTTGTLLARVRPLHEVQDFLDHADPRTTRTYVHSDQTLNNSPAYTAASFIHDENT